MTWSRWGYKLSNNSRKARNRDIATRMTLGHDGNNNWTLRIDDTHIKDSGEFRDGLKNGAQVARVVKLSSGRSGQQQKEQIFTKPRTTFQPNPVQLPDQH